MALRRFQYVSCSDIPYLNMYDVGDVVFMMKHSWIIASVITSKAANGHQFKTGQRK